jgi:hypothetical protein
MSTLETQYRKFLEANQKLKLSFEEWKKVNARLVKQALINMMKADEELGLYDEPFKHKVETIPAEEILANRSNAYEFLDFDKQETLEEDLLDTAIQVVGDSNTTTIKEFLVKHKWQQGRSYSEEEVLELIIECSKWQLPQTDEDLFKIKEWFDTIKKK